MILRFEASSIAHSTGMKVANDKEWFTMTIRRGTAHGVWVKRPHGDRLDGQSSSMTTAARLRLEAGNISLQGHDPTTNPISATFEIVDLSKKRKLSPVRSRRYFCKKKLNSRFPFRLLCNTSP